MEKRLETLSGPAWEHVRYFTTTRVGGYSQGDWAGFNLGQHCGDKPSHVAKNRALLNTLLPSQPHWLQQVHGTQLYRALRPAQQVAGADYEQAPLADAAWTTAPNTVIAVLTADCLPIVIADSQGTVVGVAHAGWRGLAAGVIARLFLQLQQQAGPDAHWQAWIGPAISQRYFEVGQEVYDAFVQKNSVSKCYFIATSTPHKYMADLAGLAASQLASLAKDKLSIHLSLTCTYDKESRYYSYRRQAATGRIATLAWLV